MRATHKNVSGKVSENINTDIIKGLLVIEQARPDEKSSMKPGGAAQETTSGCSWEKRVVSIEQEGHGERSRNRLARATRVRKEAEVNN